MKLEIKNCRKYYKGDIVKYRIHGNEILEGEIVQAPSTYACDRDTPSLGDFYIISNHILGQGYNGEITCYVGRIK